jgi:hypothetical protein
MSLHQIRLLNPLDAAHSLHELGDIQTEFTLHSPQMKRVSRSNNFFCRRDRMSHR